MTRLVHWCVTVAILVVTSTFFIKATNQAPAENGPIDQIVTSESLELRSREKRDVYFDKMRTCVRKDSLNHTQRDVKCVMSKMFYILKLRTEASCKNCLSFFYCKANLEASTQCNGTDVIKTMDAITKCSDLRNSDDEAEMVIEAATHGRSNGDCDSLYLCSRGCRYASSNTTCTATCR